MRTFDDAVPVREDPVVPPWGPDDSIEQRSEAVLMAATSGAVTTEQAGRLMLLLKTHADLSSVAEMRAELDELKEKIR